MRLFSLRQFSVLASLTAVAVLSAGALLAAANAEAPAIGAPAPAFTAVDTNGVEHSLSDFADKTVVLEWTNHDCPFVKKHYTKSTNMQDLQAEATANGVVWIKIISSAPGEQGYLTAEEANALEEERGSKATAVILDPDGTVGAAYDARVTPHMYVIENGVLAYKGAIDSKKSTRAGDIPESTNYVAAALDALAAGEPIAVTETTAYGCSVKNAYL